jgi:NAD(P)-dependent dehydrogenase (short-subunit alcohol dehydrogenase family)
MSQLDGKTAVITGAAFGIGLAAVRLFMDLGLRVLSGMGHLTTPAHLDDVVSLVAEAASQAAG